MKKKIVAMIAMSMFVSGLSGIALAGSKEISGEVKEVLGDRVTIEIEKGKAKGFSTGDEVKIEVEKKGSSKKEKKPSPMGGMDMLQGC